jgi:hypothetical protein
MASSPQAKAEFCGPAYTCRYRSSAGSAPVNNPNLSCAGIIVRLPICHGAEFATHVVYQRECGSCARTMASGWLHEALQCADHRNRERRRPPRKLAVLASSAANCFVTLFSCAASSVTQLRRTDTLKCRGASLRWQSFLRSPSTQAP